MVELTLRLVFSLAVVIGLLLVAVRVAGKRFSGAPDALVRVVHRQPLSRGAAVVVVTVGSRVLVLGSTEHQVTVLSELDPEELVSADRVEEAMAAEDAGTVGTHAAHGHAGQLAGSVRGNRRAPGALDGSLLSPDTWKQALAALTSSPRNRR